MANRLSAYLSILMGKGDGTFQPATQTPPVPESSFVTVGDFNGDGKLDLVSLGDLTINVLFGNGDGTFQSPVTTQPSFAVQTIGIGDFNGDGKLDVATSGQFGTNSTVNILLGNGDAERFQQEQVIPATARPLLLQSPTLTAMASSTSPWQISKGSGSVSG